VNQKLLNSPKFYLDERWCENIYSTFSHLVKFNQPLPSFHDRYPHRLESLLGSISQGMGEVQFYPTVLDAATG